MKINLTDTQLKFLLTDAHNRGITFHDLLDLIIANYIKNPKNDIDKMLNNYIANVRDEE